MAQYRTQTSPPIDDDQFHPPSSVTKDSSPHLLQLRTRSPWLDADAKNNQDPDDQERRRAPKHQVIVQCPSRQTSPARPPAHGLGRRVAEGDVADQHAGAQEPPEPHVVAGTHHHGLDKRKVQPGAAQRSVQEGRPRGEGAPVPRHGRQVRLGRAEHHDGPVYRKQRLDDG
ncbi:hypothetical protein J3459_015272 [Metarhizium acridum]|uniref:Uncharacterized protein n=1 Tax=Metarhizium acridum (strain CQMa 102) TaxID=655827 RepID=E9DUZ2_METAQ|nr:uncharacterized protein MAC_01525 [Metarhizium acridum CQMa 102]EFY92559.1 hypothetical protein MAC_01525 [Metarhizium acridum CQMa 102]KAG8413527.1 hypothetical protein J3459_015272 [Metarhizium acridum]